LHLVLAGFLPFLAGTDPSGQVSLVLARLITSQGLVQRLLGYWNLLVSSLERESPSQLEGISSHQKVGPLKFHITQALWAEEQLIVIFFNASLMPLPLMIGGLKPMTE